MGKYPCRGTSLLLDTNSIKQTHMQKKTQKKHFNILNISYLYLRISVIFCIFVLKIKTIQYMKIKKSDMNIIHIINNAEAIWLRFRWKNGTPVCPYCERKTKQYLCKNNRYKCNHCNRKYSSRVKTIFQNSKLSTAQILCAIFIILAENAISTGDLARMINVSYNTSWFLVKRLQHALNQDTPLSGLVALDEVYLGGKWKNKHWKKKLELLHYWGVIPPEQQYFNASEAFQAMSLSKTPVLGGNDGNNIFLKILPNNFNSKNIKTILEQHTKDVVLYVSDDSPLYCDLSTVREINCHSRKQYISPNGYSSNSIEGTFSHYQRQFRYATTHCKDYYLQLYLDLFVFKWNTRNCTMEESWSCLFGCITKTTCRYKDIREYCKQQNSKDTVKIIKQKKREEEQYIIDSLENKSCIVTSITTKK